MTRLKYRMKRIALSALLKDQPNDWDVAHTAFIDGSFKEKQRRFLFSSLVDVPYVIGHQFIDHKDRDNGIIHTYHAITIESQGSSISTGMILYMDGLLAMPFNSSDKGESPLTVHGHIPFIHIPQTSVENKHSQSRIDVMLKCLMDYINDFFTFRHGKKFHANIEKEIYHFGISHSTIYNRKLIEGFKNKDDGTKKEKMTLVDEFNILNLDILKDMQAHRMNNVFMKDPNLIDKRRMEYV